MNTNQTTGEYLQRQLIDMIELAKTTGTNAVEFVQSQAPDVVQQLIKWKMAEAVFRTVWPLLLVATFVIISFLAVRWMKKDRVKNRHRSADDYPQVIVPVVLMCVSMVPLILYSIAWCADVIKIYVAPKVYLLEYAAKLIK